MTKPLVIDVAYDIICPWCWIGKRHLDAALAELREQEPGTPVAIRWQAVQLLPQLPADGLPYLAFYLQRLGSVEAVHWRQAQVRAAAESAGLQIAFERIGRMPNTARAHALLSQVAEQSPGYYPAVLERLFAAHFQRGENIGEVDTLLAIAGEFGLETKALRTKLSRARTVPAPARDMGSQGVPHFRFDDRFDLTGAQPPAALLAAMTTALNDGSRRTASADFAQEA